MMQIKDVLREARKVAGKTQRQVADAADMDVTQYNGYETGRGRPAPATLARIGAALGVTVEALLERERGAAEHPTQDQADDPPMALADIARTIAHRLGVSPHQVTLRIEVSAS